MNKIKVLYIIGQLSRGGAEQQLYNLLKYSSEVEAVVLSLSHGGYWRDPIQTLGCNVIELQRRSHLEWRRLRDVRRVIHRVQPDIVTLFADGISGMYARLGTLLAGDYPLVVCERSHPTFHPVWLRALLPLMNRFVQAIICNSYSAYDYMVSKNLIARERVYFVPNCIELADFKLTVGAPSPVDWLPDREEMFVIGTVGHLTRVKNPGMVVRIAEKVIAHVPNARFVLVGKGPLQEQLQREVLTRGLDGIVFLAGERRDIPSILHQMDVFLLTSFKEGTPNALLEAMASGLPCIATDVGDCGRLICESKAGEVFSLHDINGFVQYIVTLAHTPELRRQLGHNGQVYVQQFTPEKMAQRFLSIYRELLPSDKRCLS